MAFIDVVCPSCDITIENLYVGPGFVPSDYKPPLCEICNTPMRKIFSVPFLNFRGDGWTGAQKHERKDK